MKAQKTDPTAKLGKQLTRLNETLMRSNRLFHRFLMGIAFGLGTALGASIIATIVILVLVNFLQITGLEMLLGPEMYEKIINTSL